MGEQINADVSEIAGKEAPPPPYSARLTQTTSSSESTTVGTGPYRPFPTEMNLYRPRWNIKTYHLCGEDKADHLFTVEIHLGYSGKLPLGLTPGMHLRNGTSSKDPLLAAAGSESPWGARPYSFSIDTIVWLPPLDPEKRAVCTLVPKTMRGRVNPDKSVGFVYTIEVGEKERPEAFEWRKFKDGQGEEEDGKDGFRLLRLGPARRRESNAGEGSSSGAASGECSSPAEECEVLAILTWCKGMSEAGHPFRLRMTGSAESGKMGDRWSIMCVITALRLYELRVNGKTTRFQVGVGELISS